MKLCLVGALRCVVIHVKCEPNRLRGYGAVGVENVPSPLLWPVAYTTACTTYRTSRDRNTVKIFNSSITKHTIFQ